ncbi:MAG: endonuclease domain-containing protein [Bacteroidales bacterium]|nr:endonuclease domain-containing protein [Bacteroidales bacterium]
MNFNRQKIIGNYIVDFYVPSLSFVIEIDGCSHIYKEEYDLERDRYLKSFGLKVFKIADIEVKRNLSWVMNSLRDFIISEYSIVNIS